MSYKYLLFFLFLTIIQASAQMPTLVKDINPGKNSSRVSGLTILNSGLIFSADDGKTGFELWKSDGTEAGTVLVKDINPGTLSAFGSTNAYFKLFKGQAYFWADDGTNGQELWRTDGTATGTTLFFESVKGKSSSYIDLDHFYKSSTVEYKNELYFIAKASNGTNQALYKTDGTTVTLIKEYATIDAQLVVANDLLFFYKAETGKASELYKTDGTAASTSFVSTSARSNLVSLGPKVLFRGDKDQLMASDGTTAGTVVINDSLGSLGAGGVINGKLYHFFKNSVWESDGTRDGNRKMTTLQFSGQFRSITVFKNKLYFITEERDFPSETNQYLRVFDPSTNQISSLRNVSRAGTGSITTQMASNGKYLFWYTGYNNANVFYTDGLNTSPLYNTEIGYTPENNIEFGDYLYVTGVSSRNESDAQGSELSRIKIADPSAKCQGFQAFVSPSGNSVNELPIPCVGGVVTLSATAGGGLPPYQYEWKRNGVAIGAVSSPLSATATGDYTAFFADANGCQYIANTVHLINENPSVVITGDRFFCGTQSTTLTALASGVNAPFTYKWKSGNIDIGIQASQNISKGGAYTAIVTDTKGCQASVVTQVADNPSLPVSISGISGFCSGQNTSLTAVASGGSGSYMYQWRQNGSVITGATSQTITAGTVGVYTVSVADSKSCVGSSNSFTVTQKPSPSATITSSTGSTTYLTGASITLSVSSVTGQTYQWRKDNQPITGATNNAYVVNQPGSYVVIVTRDGCSSTSSPTSIALITAIEPGLSGIGMEISPNPAADVCRVKILLDNSAIVQVSLLTPDGKSVQYWQSGRNARAHETTFSLSSLPAGLYIVQAIADTKKSTLKLIKP